MLLGLKRLMQSFRIAPARHHAAGELVNNDKLVVADDVILVALEQRVGLQRLLDMVNDGDVGGIVHRAFLQQAGLGQQLLDIFVSRFCQVDRALLFVEVEMLFRQARNQLVDLIVEIGLVFRRTGNDQRRAGFVDQDRIHLVHDGEVVRTLDHVGQLVLHVVAKIIEAEFVVGAVGDVGGVSFLALLVVKTMHDHANGQAKKRVDLAHPRRIAAGEIIIDRDDVDALARKRIEIAGERGDQCLAFAGAHLGDAALVQDHAADQLNIKVPLPKRALGGLAYGGEGWREQIVEGFARGQFGAEPRCASAQVFIRKFRDLRLKGVDRGDFRDISLETAVVGGAKQPARERTEHQQCFLLRRPGVGAWKTASEIGSGESLVNWPSEGIGSTHFRKT